MKKLTTKQKVIRTLGAIVLLALVILILALVRLDGWVEVGIADVATLVYILSVWFPDKEKTE